MMKYFLLSTLCLLAFTRILAQETVVTNLSADGPGNTYSLLTSVLGGTPYEVPDCDHGDGFQHIDEIFDDEIQKNVFRFFIHADIDTDRCRTNTDRQRNEIKTYGPSPDYLLGDYGETFIYEWYFKIDAAFQPSSSFTHLFQLKASGGSDDANPLITLSPRKGSPDLLELIYGQGNNIYTTVQTIELNQIRGNWVRVYCKTLFAEDEADFELRIYLQDGTEIMAFSDKLDMWREGANFIRPKWGIYRSLNNASSLRDEAVLFADFRFTEIQNNCPVWYEDADGDGLGDPNNAVISCTQPAGYVDNKDDLACRNYYEDADGDGLGDPSVSLYGCDQPEGYVKNNADRDCGNYYQDLDGDGLGNPAVSVYSCEQPEGFVKNKSDDEDSLPTAAQDPTIEGVTVYPTITDKWLRISGIIEPDFTITDMLGTSCLEGKGNLIDTSGLQPGLYVLRISNRSFRFVRH